jgi:hypothetical protein
LKGFISVLLMIIQLFRPTDLHGNKFGNTLKAYNEIQPRVEYRLTNKGQELVESVIYLLNWDEEMGKRLV